MRKPSILGGPCHPWLFLEEVRLSIFVTLFQALLKGFSAIFSIENTLESCRFEAPLQDSFKATRHAKAGLQPNDNFIHIQASQREVDRDFQSVYSRLVLCKTFRLVYTMTQL